LHDDGCCGSAAVSVGTNHGNGKGGCILSETIIVVVVVVVVFIVSVKMWLPSEFRNVYAEGRPHQPLWRRQ
jgi:hypothetical protein